ncbi:MAG TPA: neutral/alkaline non-lysosomal ceramidase N-terminal domain-containing protein [Pirellulales bacterium]|jgi:hypothetical protein|nr:neutral/alkaline non-lysosomal ceramidase N-terminal domain-containing protein [Pirellulales bacterium]
MRTIAALHTIVGLAMVAALPIAAAEPTQTWKAGVAEVTITPTAPVWMSGYRRDRPSEGTAQDLRAKALVLEDAAGRRAVLITMDLVGIDRATSERACQQLASKYGLERRQIAFNCSHTHHGPAVGRNLEGLLLIDDAQWQRIDAYTGQLIDKLVGLTGEAIAHLQPALVSRGQGCCTVAVNRRTNPRNDVPQVRERGQLRGPSDFDVPLLAVRGADGKLLAVAFGYACHPTTLPVDYQFSGDYAGYAQAAIEAAHPGAIALFWAGCGGDQAPRPRDTVELAQHYGGRLAVAVDEVLAGAMQPVTGPLLTSYAEIPLRLEKPPTRDELEQNTQSRNAHVAALARRLLAGLDAGQSLRETYPYPIEVWQLGEQRWIFLGGEVVVDYALRLKHELGPATWVAGYSNDVMAYIPSRRVLAEGGYEGANAQVYYGLPNRWSQAIESQIVDEAQRQCRALAATASGTNSAR